MNTLQQSYDLLCGDLKSGCISEQDLQALQQLLGLSGGRPLSRPNLCRLILGKLQNGTAVGQQQQQQQQAQSVVTGSQIKVRVVTWNMGDNAQSVRDWQKELQDPEWSIITKRNYDVLFLTLQEDNNVGAMGKAVADYLTAKGNDYQVLKMQTVLVPPLKFSVKNYVFVRKSLRPTQIETKRLCLQTPVCTKATVGVAFVVNDNLQLIFMGSHLPIDTKREDLGFDKRRDAVKQTLVKVFDALKSTRMPHVAFWAGDLNFRKDANGRDQLDRLKDGRELRHFMEAPVQFPPTCKMELDVLCDRPSSDTQLIDKCYASAKRRPSHCDRILYATAATSSSVPGAAKVETINSTYQAYGDARSIQKSDHNLVYADFIVSTTTK